MTKIVAIVSISGDYSGRNCDESQKQRCFAPVLA